MLDLSALAFSSLTPQREATVDALTALSAHPDDAARVLKLSPRQRGEIDVNAALRESPTAPAIDRYTGVLFDALGADSLDAAAREWLGEHAAIHSAPFGPVGALDEIPNYRLGAQVRLPGHPTSKKMWADAVTHALSQHPARLVLDLRSEAYVALGPVPRQTPSVYLRVVTRGADGTVRALNHFNKHGKGALVRTLSEDRPDIGGVDDLLAWAAAAGVELRAVDSELQLVV